MAHVARVGDRHPSHARYTIEERDCRLILRCVELAIEDKRGNANQG